jgi:hypothetical protein
VSFLRLLTFKTSKTFKTTGHESFHTQVLQKAAELGLKLECKDFVQVFSESLGEMLFFARDKDARATLIQAGAEPFAIYTKDELRVLVEQNRVAPLSIQELRRVHEIKRTFSGRISS